MNSKEHIDYEFEPTHAEKTNIRSNICANEVEINEYSAIQVAVQTDDLIDNTATDEETKKTDDLKDSITDEEGIQIDHPIEAESDDLVVQKDDLEDTIIADEEKVRNSCIDLDETDPNPGEQKDELKDTSTDDKMVYSGYLSDDVVDGEQLEEKEDLRDVVTPLYIISDDTVGNSDIFTKRQIIKNLLVLCIAFMVLFTSYGSMANLQSSLNMESGTGSGSLAVVYAALILSCLFLPSFMIAQLGCKWAIPISITGYILYMVANIYPVWGTMVPSAILVGLGAAPLWSAKCTYLTIMGVWYARMTGNSEDAIINRFFGIFFMFFQTYQIWGNIIVFTVLSPSSNTSVSLEERTCGAQFCPAQMSSSNNTNLERPVETKVYILCGIYTALAIVGMLIIIFFLDPMKTKEGKGRSTCVSPRLLVDTFRHIAASRYQKLLIPLTIYSGIEQAIIGSDFTRSFITCSLGINYVGYILICYGVVDAACSYLFGHLVKHFGHLPFFILGAVLHASCKIALLMWVPDSSQLYVFYIIVIFWGMGDAVVQTQINALYGLLFKDKTEPGFANYRLWESLGFILQYAYNDILCTSTKLYISLAVLVTGMCGYLAVEVLHRREEKRRHTL